MRVASLLKAPILGKSEPSGRGFITRHGPFPFERVSIARSATQAFAAVCCRRPSGSQPSPPGHQWRAAPAALYAKRASARCLLRRRDFQSGTSAGITLCSRVCSFHTGAMSVSPEPVGHPVFKSAAAFEENLRPIGQISLQLRQPHMRPAVWAENPGDRWM
jgi:hypothetical protein